MSRCENGGDCTTEFTCGRFKDGPSVDHHSEKCSLDYLDCINQHYRHDCAHDFDSGPWVEFENGGASSCKCGVTADAHDFMHGP